MWNLGDHDTDMWGSVEHDTICVTQKNMQQAAVAWLN